MLFASYRIPPARPTSAWAVSICRVCDSRLRVWGMTRIQRPGIASKHPAVQSVMNDVLSGSVSSSGVATPTTNGNGNANGNAMHEQITTAGCFESEDSACKADVGLGGVDLSGLRLGSGQRVKAEEIDDVIRQLYLVAEFVSYPKRGASSSQRIPPARPTSAWAVSICRVCDSRLRVWGMTRIQIPMLSDYEIHLSVGGFEEKWVSVSLGLASA
jgi:hypothetical protein